MTNQITPNLSAKVTAIVANSNRTDPLLQSSAIENTATNSYSNYILKSQKCEI